MCLRPLTLILQSPMPRRGEHKNPLLKASYLNRGKLGIWECTGIRSACTANANSLLRDAPLLGPSPTHVTFTLRAAACVLFPSRVCHSALPLHHSGLRGNRARWRLCARHGSALYRDPAVCRSPKRGVSPYFTEAPWIPGSGLVRGQGCSPYCSGKPTLFLLRGSVRSHSANPGREGEMRGDGCLVTLAVTSAHLVWQTGYIYTDFSYTLTKARKTHLAQ